MIVPGETVKAVKGAVAVQNAQIRERKQETGRTPAERKTKLQRLMISRIVALKGVSAGLTKVREENAALKEVTAANNVRGTGNGVAIVIASLVGKAVNHDPVIPLRDWNLSPLQRRTT